jgi:hypothetical protein
MDVKLSISTIGANIIGYIGVISSLVGITFQNIYPWITFKSDRFLLPRYREGFKYWEWVYYQLSPFHLKIQSETDLSISTFFYRENMTVIGILCIIGIGISLVSIFLRKRKLTIFGGILIVISMIFFSISLPGIYPNFAWGPGAKSTFIGAFLILLSAFFSILLDNIRRNKEYKNSLIEIWEDARSARA